MLFQSLKKTVDTIVRGAKKAQYDAIDNNLSTIADANTAQMVSGLNADGGQLGLYRSEPYARFKKAIGSRSPFGTVDLKLSGDFHSGVFARRKGDTITISSTDNKTGELTAKYGENIFGITEEKRNDIVNDQIIPELWDWYSKLIQQI